MSNSNWAFQNWPRLLVRTGFALFCLACVYSARLPAEAIFAGPAMMVAGVAMIERNKRESRRQQHGRFGDTAAHSDAR